MAYVFERIETITLVAFTNVILSHVSTYQVRLNEIEDTLKTQYKHMETVVNVVIAST